MTTYNCYTQADLDAALKKANAQDLVICRGSGIFTACDSSRVTAYDFSQVTAYDFSQVTACDSSRVTAYDSSQIRAYDSSQIRAYSFSQVMACDSSRVMAYDFSRVMAYGSSQIRACDSSRVTACDSSQVMAYDSSQVTAYSFSQVTACNSSRVMAYDSSQVTAYDSSQVTACDSSQVMAYGSSQVMAYDSSQIRASRYVAVTRQPRHSGLVVGGTVIVVPVPTTPAEWCDVRGIEPNDGVVILFKAVRSDYRSGHGMSYAPGSMPEAQDWDGGEAECGGGLHFCATPVEAAGFDSEATRYVACPVSLADIADPKPTAGYPNKIKARRVCAPCWEVDVDGNRIETTAVAP